MKHWVFMAALASSAVQAQDMPAHDAEFTRYVEQIVDAASSSRDARVLMAAASFGQSSPAVAAKTDALYLRALRLGADDPVVWWIAATDCPASKWVCDAPAATRRLRELAPNNAAGWMLEREDVRVDFERAAKAVRYDPYDSEHMHALLAVLALVPPPAESLAEAGRHDPANAEQRVRVALAFGKWLANASPSMHRQHTDCRVAKLDRDACIAFARVLAERSNNLIAQRVGGSLLLALLPPGPERNAVRDARRRSDWLLEAHREIAGTDDYPAFLLHWLEPNANELTVMRAALEDQGVPLDPPPDWRSDREPILPGG